MCDEIIFRFRFRFMIIRPHLITIEVVEGVVLVPEGPLPTWQPTTLPPSRLWAFSFPRLWHLNSSQDDPKFSDIFPRCRSVAAWFPWVNRFKSKDFWILRLPTTSSHFSWGGFCSTQHKAHQPPLQPAQCLINLNRAKLTWIKHRLVPVLVSRSV